MNIKTIKTGHRLWYGASSAVTAVCLAACMVLVSRAMGLAPWKFLNAFYLFVNMNVTIAQRPGGISVYAYIYAAAATGLLISAAAVLAGRIFNADTPTVKQIITRGTLTVFSFMLAVHIIGWSSFVSGEVAKYKGKTLSERKTMLFGAPYTFAEYCKSVVTEGPHKAVLITDLDPLGDKDDIAVKGRLLYHLYPIDAGNITDRPVDCFIVFSRSEPKLPVELTRKFRDLHVAGKYLAIGVSPGKDNNR